MPHCSKCGKEVAERDNFCPNCGANLAREALSTRTTGKESFEKEEKAEKSEKEEKREKEGASPAAALIGGVILVFIGVTYYLSAAGLITLRYFWPYLLLLVGLIIVIAAVYAGITASKRNPRP